MRAPATRLAHDAAARTTGPRGPIAPAPAPAGIAAGVPRARPPVRLAVGLVRLYQWLAPPAVRGGCRFVPTCSEYAREALERHGLRRGLALTLRRLARCHPLGPSGPDPVP